ncbi:MAG: hypothetical protein K2X08_03840 [Chlamydiales bacterium]|nr:hypothetical protein [Chlamydiales bacterium]
MTDLLIFCGKEENISLDELPEETLQQVYYKEDFTLDHWKTWCKYIEESKFRNYLFITRSSPFDASYLIYALINIKTFKELFLKYEHNFKKIDPSITFDRALEELDQPDSVFWNSVFKDHYLCGLLYGYGESNAKHFTETIISHKNPQNFSENLPDELIKLPIYALSEIDTQTTHYKNEKKRIEKIYQGKDSIQVTLNQLRN